MSNRRLIITEELVDAAVEYLSTQGAAAADAKGHQVRAHYHRRKVYAKLVLAAPHKAVEMRKAWAEAHADHQEACEKLAQAERVVEWHHNERSRADTVIEMWRTEQATLRGLAKF